MNMEYFTNDNVKESDQNTQMANGYDDAESETDLSNHPVADWSDHLMASRYLDCLSIALSYIYHDQDNDPTFYSQIEKFHDAVVEQWAKTYHPHEDWSLARKRDQFEVWMKEGYGSDGKGQSRLAVE